MKKMTIRAGFSLATMFAAQAGFAEGYSDDVVRIGVLTDMASIYSDSTGTGSVTAVKLAIEEFGGEVNGVPIEMVSGDHQFKADVSALLARQWFDDEGVDMIVDLAGSSTAEAAKEVGRELDKITMIVGAGSSGLANEGCSPVSIHWNYDTYSNAFAMGPTLVKEGYDKWFLITVDYSFGHALSADLTAAVESAGGQIVGEVRHPFGTADFSSYMLQAQASGANMVGLANTGPDALNSLKSMREMGLIDAGINAAVAVGDANVFQAVGLPTVQGIRTVIAGYHDLNDETKAFSARFEAIEGKPPQQTHLGDYTAVQHYLESVKAAGTDTTSDVMEAIRATPINNMLWKNGKVREDGRAVHEMYVWEAKTPEESTGEWDVLKLNATISGDDAFRPLSDSSCPLVKS